MLESKPLVSIGLPVYNGEEYVRRALDSLLAQDYENFELIISENASTDGTLEVCREYACRDPRIQLHSNAQNIGILANFGLVLERACGRYFMWAAADDYWDPQFLRATVEELEARPEAAVAMCAVKRVGEDGEFRDLVRHEGRSNPNDMGHLRLALALAAGQPYHIFIYGLFRTPFIKEAFHNFPNVAGGDRLCMCQVALATKFRYIDRVLHVRQVSDEPITVRYSEEELGKIWKHPLAGWIQVLSIVPYFSRSTLIPPHRKLWIPLIVFVFCARHLRGSLLRMMRLVRSFCCGSRLR